MQKLQKDNTHSGLRFRTEIKLIPKEKLQEIIKMRQQIKLDFMKSFIDKKI
jgi:hypothetical protein